MSNPYQTNPHPPAGWYPDPAGSTQERYWDGASWTSSLRPPPPPPLYGGAPNPYIPVGSPGGAAWSVGPTYAHWGWRVLAAIIDAMVLGVVFFIIQLFYTPAFRAVLEQWVVDVERWSVSAVGPMPWILDYPGATEAFVTYMGLSWLVTVAYHVLFLGLISATPGKLAVGAKVQRYDGSNVGFGPAIVRQIAAVVIGVIPLVNLINLLAPLWTSKKQTFHDMVASTVVVKVR